MSEMTAVARECAHCGLPLWNVEDYGVIGFRGWPAGRNVYSHPGMCWAETRDRFADQADFISPPSPLGR